MHVNKKLSVQSFLGQVVQAQLVKVKVRKVRLDYFYLGFWALKKLWGNFPSSNQKKKKLMQFFVKLTQNFW